MLVPARHLYWILPLGVVLLILLSMGQGLLGHRRRKRLAEIATATFGKTGAGLINLLMAVGLVGWSGFHGGVAGASVAELLQLPGWLGALLIIALLYLLNSWGINRWAALTWVTTGAALALTIFALTTIDLNSAVQFAAGSEQTAAQSNGTLTVGNTLLAISTIIGYATLFSLRTPDFTWDFATGRDVVKVKLFLFFPLLFATGAGALLYFATGSWNIADLLTQTGSAAIGHIFLIVAVVSPLISGWYSGAFALSHLTPLRPNQSTLLICLLGFLLAATRFDQQLLPFLGYLGASLGPALVVILLTQQLRPKPRSPRALLAWLVGAGSAVLLHALQQPLHLLVGSLVSTIMLLLCWQRDSHKS